MWGGGGTYHELQLLTWRKSKGSVLYLVHLLVNDRPWNSSRDAHAIDLIQVVEY